MKARGELSYPRSGAGGTRQEARHTLDNERDTLPPLWTKQKKEVGEVTRLEAWLYLFLRAVNVPDPTREGLNASFKGGVTSLDARRKTTPCYGVV